MNWNCDSMMVIGRLRTSHNLKKYFKLIYSHCICSWKKLKSSASTSKYHCKLTNVFILHWSAGQNITAYTYLLGTYYTYTSRNNVAIFALMNATDRERESEKQMAHCGRVASAKSKAIDQDRTVFAETRVRFSYRYSTSVVCFLGTATRAARSPKSSAIASWRILSLCMARRRRVWPRRTSLCPYTHISPSI
jgi:hypothetical protein